MSKRAIRIPPLKKGRRVRWTFEVSADVDGNKSSRPSSPSKSSKATTRSRPKRRVTSAKSQAHKSTPRTTRPDQGVRSKVVAVAPPAAPPPHADRPARPTQLVGRRPTTAVATSHSRMIAVAAIATLVVAVLALPRRSAVVPAAPLDDSTSEVAASVPMSVAPPSTARITTAAPVAAPPRLEVASHLAGESLEKTEGAAQNPASLAAKRQVMSPPALDLHDNKTTVESRRGDALVSTSNSVALPAPPKETEAVAQVTITGCLEGSAKDRFRLTDTDGATAPKARSWRTGFLKKHSAAIDLVGAADSAALQKDVGRRVTVTGVQTNRELEVSSVHVIAPACD